MFLETVHLSIDSFAPSSYSTSMYFKHLPVRNLHISYIEFAIFKTTTKIRIQAVINNNIILLFYYMCFVYYLNYCVVRIYSKYFVISTNSSYMKQVSRFIGKKWLVAVSLHCVYMFPSLCNAPFLMLLIKTILLNIRN